METRCGRRLTELDEEHPDDLNGDRWPPKKLRLKTKTRPATRARTDRPPALKEDDLKTRYTIKMTFGDDERASALCKDSGTTVLRNPMIALAIIGAAVVGAAESAEIMLGGGLVALAGALPVIRAALRSAGDVNHKASAPLPRGR